ncbi:MAG: hypothetical protein SFU86_19790 [Pirellulaceae bacterium]|nr:hypothetical protein [Pirellulaceae bacterium]
MDPFPDEWELLALFEAEPTVVDRGVPWEYNVLIFETTRGQSHVRCEIEPGYEKIKLNWWDGPEERLSLELNSVLGLRVVTGGGRDYLVASFRDPHLFDLEFHLKPTVCLRWGTSNMHLA